MIKNKIHSGFSIIVLVVIGISGCALTPEGPDPLAANDAVNYEVKAGDSLAKIALKLTGDLKNWQILAARNDISDPKTLIVGQVIMIPTQLLSDIHEINTNAQIAAAPLQSTIEPTIQTSLPVTTGNGVSVARAWPTTANETAQIRVTPVRINRSFDLQPIDSLTHTTTNAPHVDANAPHIKVSGSYYPKGIYDEPANYARLLTRATPGTVFQLDRKVNDWYKILTNAGIGYIRQIDATLLD